MGQLGFSSTFLEWVQLIPFLRLDMVDNILWDVLSNPYLGDQIRYPTKNLLDELTRELDNPSKRKVVSYLTIRSKVIV